MGAFQRLAKIPSATSDSLGAMSSELPLASSSVSLSSSMNFCMTDHCSIVSRSGSFSSCCTMLAWPRLEASA